MKKEWKKTERKRKKERRQDEWWAERKKTKKGLKWIKTSTKSVQYPENRNYHRISAYKNHGWGYFSKLNVDQKLLCDVLAYIKHKFHTGRFVKRLDSSNQEPPQPISQFYGLRHPMDPQYGPQGSLLWTPIWTPYGIGCWFCVTSSCFCLVLYCVHSSHFWTQGSFCV